MGNFKWAVISTIREGLTEDELEIFDLLKKDKMTQEETQKARFAAKSLLHRLLEEHPRVLVQDWYKDTQTQKQVRSAVEQVLDNKQKRHREGVVFVCWWDGGTRTAAQILACVVSSAANAPTDAPLQLV